MRAMARIIVAAAVAGCMTAPVFAGGAPDFAALSRIVGGVGLRAAALGRDRAAAAGAGAASAHRQHVRRAGDGRPWGSPHRLIAAAIDQPGYVVSGIDARGYLRVQRLPQREPNPVFDTLQFAQPAYVVTPEGPAERRLCRAQHPSGAGSAGSARDVARRQSVRGHRRELGGGGARRRRRHSRSGATRAAADHRRRRRRSGCRGGRSLRLGGAARGSAGARARPCRRHHDDRIRDAAVVRGARPGSGCSPSSRSTR